MFIITIIQLQVLLTFSMDGNSRIRIYACDEHFQCSFALASGRRRDGGEMINSLIEIWTSRFVIPACSIIVSCHVFSAKIVHSTSSFCTQMYN